MAHMGVDRSSELGCKGLGFAWAPSCNMGCSQNHGPFFGYRVTFRGTKMGPYFWELVIYELEM